MVNFFRYSYLSRFPDTLTAGGVCFITIEDETGYSKPVVFEKLFETYPKEIVNYRLLTEGRLQLEGMMVYVIASKYFDFTKMLGNLVQREADDLS